jgi:hypothetical protein
LSKNINVSEQHNKSSYYFSHGKSFVALNIRNLLK